MGTRHLTCVVLDGRFVVAQYGQWDGYPEDAGATIARFICQPIDWVRFRHGLSWRVKPVSQARVTQAWEDVGADPELVAMEVAKRFKERHPEWDRDIGAGILPWLEARLRQDVNVELQLEPEFGAESLFCEFAYVLDLDAGSCSPADGFLEVYQGFNKEPVPATNRFAGFEPIPGYKQVALRDEIPFAVVRELGVEGTVERMRRAMLREEGGE